MNNRHDRVRRHVGIVLLKTVDQLLDCRHLTLTDHAQMFTLRSHIVNAAAPPWMAGPCAAESGHVRRMPKGSLVWTDPVDRDHRADRGQWAPRDHHQSCTKPSARATARRSALDRSTPYKLGGRRLSAPARTPTARRSRQGMAHPRPTASPAATTAVRSVAGDAARRGANRTAAG